MSAVSKELLLAYLTSSRDTFAAMQGHMDPETPALDQRVVGAAKALTEVITFVKSGALDA